MLRAMFAWTSSALWCWSGIALVLGTTWQLWFAFRDLSEQFQQDLRLELAERQTQALSHLYSAWRSIFFRLDLSRRARQRRGEALEQLDETQADLRRVARVKRLLHAFPPVVLIPAFKRYVNGLAERANTPDTTADTQIQALAEEMHGLDASDASLMSETDDLVGRITTDEAQRRAEMRRRRVQTAIGWALLTVAAIFNLLAAIASL